MSTKQLYDKVRPVVSIAWEQPKFLALEMRRYDKTQVKAILDRICVFNMLSLGASLVSFGIGNWTKKDQQGIRRQGGGYWSQKFNSNQMPYLCRSLAQSIKILSQIMRGDIVTTRKQLKKYDDTKPAPPKTRKPVNKLIPKPASRTRKSKQPKLIPGQQILTFKPKIIKSEQKELNFFCYDQRTLHWPQELTRKVIHHNVDNDCESNEYIVDREVSKCVASLVQEIAFQKFMQLEDTNGFDVVGAK